MAGDLKGTGLADNQGKEITCRAAVFWEKGKPAEIETINVKVPDEDEIRIKMVATAICYSDISGSQGAFGPLPIVAGHEGVGIVESVGAKVHAFKTGDTIIPLWAFQCKECRLCRIGKRNFCEVSLKALGEISEISCKGKDVRRFFRLGLFAEYVVLKQRLALKIQPVKELEKVSLYGCCMPTGYGAAKYTAEVFEGAVCVVWGLGAIGMAAVLGCRDAGAARIIGINRSKEKFALAQEFGCTECISPRDHEGPLSKVLKDMTGGSGPDFVFVCVGNRAVMEDAMEACRSGGGECVLLGVDYENNISVNHKDVVFGKTLKGSYCGDCREEDIKKLVDDYAQGKIPSDKFITQILPLESINEGFEALKAGKAIRTVIKF